MTESASGVPAPAVVSHLESEPGDPPPDIPLLLPRHAAPLVAALPPPDTAVWLVLALAGAAALYWLIRRQKALRAALEIEPWAAPRAVDTTLALAQDQRAVFRLTRQGGDALHGLHTICVHLEQHSLVLLPTPDTTVATAWAGLPARVEFSISVDGGLRFFRFDSVVLRCGREGARSLLELARPIRLEPYRRRRFPRIHPARAEVAAVGLWRPDNSPTESGGEAPASRPPVNPACLGTPLFVFRPGAATSLRLDSLSASGVGVRVPRDTAPPARCLIFLCLRTDDASPLALWLDCERRHLTMRPDRTTALMGLSIAHWGRVTRADDTIPWTHAASDGSVPPLLRWTLHRAASPNL